MADDYEDYALIGRRSAPVKELPPTGQAWKGPIKFEIQSENGSGFRWLMLSADGNEYRLAKSALNFPTKEACEKEIRKFAKDPKIVSASGAN